MFHFRKISKNEFLDGKTSKNEVLDPAKKRAEMAFDRFDKNKDGYITKEELAKASSRISEEQVCILGCPKCKKV